VSACGFARTAGGAVFFAGSTPERPDEAFRLDEGQAKRLTDSDPWLAPVALGRNEVVRFAARATGFRSSAGPPRFIGALAVLLR
jgi:dipeptidyl aminopeptidase/acylaminoacyl peptidase